MKVVPLISERDNSIYVRLNHNLIAFFGAKSLEFIKANERPEYDVFISGTSRALNRVGLPTTAFLELVQPSDILVVAPKLAICPESGYLETRVEIDGVVEVVRSWPNTPVPFDRNLTIHDERESVPMWLRLLPNGYTAIGVDSYECVNTVHEYKQTQQV